MTAPTFVSGDAIDAAVTLDDAILAMEEAFRAEAAGSWRTPRRIAASNDRGTLLAMPCARADAGASFMGAKLVTSFPLNSELGLPGVSGLYALFDGVTGRPVAVMDGARLTLIRTAAVSALAVRFLAREDASSLGLLGAGGQGEFHARAIARVRRLRDVRVWGRNPGRAEALAARLAAEGFPARAASKEDAAASDVVVTATASREPILDGASVGDRACVCAIGAHTSDTREVGSDLVARAGILAIETRDTLAEAGDLQIPAAEGRISLEDGRVVTLGALVTAGSREGAIPGPRSGAAGPALFKSCGVAFEDLALASRIVERLRASGAASL